MKNCLSIEQIEFVCESLKNWFDICQKNGKQISSSTIENSSLLRRILSGKNPHPEAPPYRFGFPDWELLENEEIQIQDLYENNDLITIDKHDGYIWFDKSKKLISYPRLNLTFEYIEKEIIPDQSCIVEGSDPTEYKYIAKFLKRILNNS
jgi:hypothetical protein